MNAWLHAHRRAALDALRQLRGSPLSFLLTVLALSLALALPAAGLWLLDNLERIGERFSDSHELTIFLHTEAGKADVAEIERRLADSPVSAFRFVPRDDALASLQKIEGMTSLLAGLPRNPLPDAFVVRPSDSRPGALTAFARQAAAWPKVTHVQHDEVWARRYAALLASGQRLAALLAGALGFALIAIAFNTARLQIAARAEEIEVASLLGATRAWIARPFFWLGLLQGGLAGLLAASLLGIAWWALHPAAQELAQLYGGLLQLTPPGLAWWLGLPALGAALCSTGAWLSCRRLG